MDFVDDDRLETLLGCQERAYHCLRGMPHEVLDDNMRTVLTAHNAAILRSRVPLRAISVLLDVEQRKENSPPHRSGQSAPPFRSFLHNCE